MLEKKSNAKLWVLLIILLILILGVGVFWLYQKGLIFSNNNVPSTPRRTIKYTGKYEMVKLLDYSKSEDDHNASSITEVGNYYVLEYYVDSKHRATLYDKNGNDVTKSVFGVDNIGGIDAILYNGTNKYYNLFLVSTTDGKYGLYDREFNPVVKLDNQVISRLDENENYFLVGDKIETYRQQDFNGLENVGVYDKSGKLIIPREYERLYSASKTLFYARKNGKFGIIDIQNKVVIPFEYDQANSKISLGLGQIFNSDKKDYYILYKDGKWGMVDGDNKEVISFDKSELFYNEYADVVIEKIYSDYVVSKLNVYDLNGELKKEITLNDNFKADFYAYYTGIESKFLLYDNETVYVLNKDLEYEKHVKPASIEVHWSYNKYLIGEGIYLKANNDKYKIYNVKDNSLYDQNEYYLGINHLTDFNGLVLCKGKSETNQYNNCGIIDYNGQKVAEFNYKSELSELGNDEEFIEFSYNYETKKYELKRTPISGECTINAQEYFVRDDIIKVDASIYDSKCNIIASDITNYTVLNDYLVMTEKFESAPYNTYKIYDISTGKLAIIDNKDGAIVTNDIRFYISDKEIALVLTDKGVYKIVIK